jgi:hypothetical protein
LPTGSDDITESDLMKTLLQSIETLRHRISELTQSNVPMLDLPSVLEWVGRVKELLEHARAADVPNSFIDQLPYLRVRIGRIEDELRNYCNPIPKPKKPNRKKFKLPDGSIVRLDFKPLCDGVIKTLCDGAITYDAKLLCDEISELLAGPQCEPRYLVDKTEESSPTVSCPMMRELFQKTGDGDKTSVRTSVRTFNRYASLPGFPIHVAVHGKAKFYRLDEVAAYLSQKGFELKRQVRTSSDRQDFLP